MTLKKWGVQTDLKFNTDVAPEQTVREAMAQSFRAIASRLELRNDQGEYLYGTPEDVEIGVVRQGLDVRLVVNCRGRQEEGGDG